MEPITRKEKFLAAAGGQSIDLPTPVTREEVFLKAIAEGGGGGGSDLPDVTAADNGKILGVVNGEWDKTDATLVCTFTKSGDTISCDKTPAEIDAAYKAGKAVVGIGNYSWGSQTISFGGTAIMSLTRINYNNNVPNYIQFNSTTIRVKDNEEDDIISFDIHCMIIGGVVAMWEANIFKTDALPTASLEYNDDVLCVQNGRWTIAPRAEVIIPDTDSANSLLATFSSFMNTALATPGELVYVRQTGTTFNDLDDIVDLLKHGTLGYIYFALGGAKQACMITSFNFSPAEIGVHITLYDVVVQPNIRVYASTDVLIKSSEIHVVGTAQLIS